MENIYLKCSDTCFQHYPYKLDDSNPIALTAQWQNDASKKGIWNGLLPDKPEIGQQYEVSMWGALKIDTSNMFWVAYFDPYSTSEGLESESGINSLLFCLCRKIKTIAINIKTILLNIEVMDTKDLTDAYKLPLSENKIAQFLDSEVSGGYYYIGNFNNFSLIKINVQSDIGWTYIISKQNLKSTIIAENVWDFHQNTWQFQHEALTLAQEKRYGIEHL